MDLEQWNYTFRSEQQIHLLLTHLIQVLYLNLLILSPQAKPYLMNHVLHLNLLTRTQAKPRLMNHVSEAFLRRKRNLMFIKHDEELHQLKKEKLTLEVEEAKLRISHLKTQVAHEEEIHRLRKEEIKGRLDKGSEGGD